MRQRHLAAGIAETRGTAGHSEATTTNHRPEPNAAVPCSALDGHALLLIIELYPEGRTGSGRAVMAAGRVERRLSAVFVADVAGYSRLMGADEVGTLKGLTESRAVLDRLIGNIGVA